MKFNADLSLPTNINIDDIAWEKSPAKGVLRKRLEQDESIVPIERVTTIVKFSAESSFSSHTHTGGEEFIVLEGTFSDQHADYPAGSYVRNPHGSQHKPFSKDGCTILVKLWQMQTDDQAHIVINTHDLNLWKKHKSEEEMLSLFNGDYEQVCMLKWAKGARITKQIFPAGVEYFVISGHFSDADNHYRKGSWLRRPPNFEQSIDVHEDCLIYRKTGHLKNPVSHSL